MSEKKSAQRVPISVIAIYSLLLYAVWAVYHFFIYDQIDKIPNEIVSSLLNDGVCKNLVWTLPAFLLISKYSDSLKVKLPEFLTWKKEYWKYLLIFPAFVIYIIVVQLVQKQPMSFSLTPSEIIIVIFVGITEEAVFRGWLLNSTMNYAKDPENEEDIPWGQYGVIAINAAMFLAIHFPKWICDGVFVTNFANLGFISIIFLSVIFSLVFLKTKNIALTAALHMFWDLLIFLIC